MKSSENELEKTVPYSVLLENGYDEDDVVVGALLMFEYQNTIWHGYIDNICREKDEVTYFVYWPN